MNIAPTPSTNTKPERDSLGRLLPGQVGLNPTGRPLGLERQVRKILGDEGVQGMIKFLINAMHNPGAHLRDRISACKILMDRGWGQPRQIVDLNTPEQRGPALSNYSTEQLEAMRKILDAPAIIDVSARTLPGGN